MSAVEKIKIAAAGLNCDEQYELFRWWVDSTAFKERQLAALKSDIAAGLDDLEHGRYQTYSDSNLMQLAEEVGRTGRERLKKSIAQDNPSAADKFIRTIIIVAINLQPQRGCTTTAIFDPTPSALILYWSLYPA